MGLSTEILALFEPTSPYRTSAFSTVILLGSAVIYLALFHPYKQKVKVPFVGVRNTSFLSLFLGGFKFVISARTIINEGYKKYGGQPFQISTYSGNRVVLSLKHVEELRNAPDSKLSFSAASVEFLKADLVGMGDVVGQDHPPHTKMIRRELTRDLAKFIDPIVDETQFAFAQEFPEAADWTPVPLNSSVLRIVARMSGRVFVGTSLCRNEEWLNTSVKFTEDLFANAIVSTLVPKFMRSFLAAWVFPYASRVTKHRKIAHRYLAPIYAELLAQQASGSGEKPKEDVYSWMLGHASPKPEMRTPEKLADFQLMLSMAAIHTTTIAVVTVMYELAARPEYIEELREEMIAIIEEDGGLLKKSTLAKMMKLDSFMKESTRVNCGYLTFMRKVVAPITLADGTHMPSGTMLAAPVRAMYYDPELVENPEEFDGFRWSKLRQQENQLNSHLFVSTSSSSLLFGHGNHACPGRFFAANEIQIMLVSILLRYDFKYLEGETRPGNWNLAEMVMQDKNRSLLFKKRANPPKFAFL